MNQSAAAAFRGVLATLAIVLSTALPAGVQPVGMVRDADVPPGAVLVGAASYYDEFSVTASGERYNPKEFTAAVQIGLRQRFGGIKSAPHYRPAYVIAESGGKRAVIRINNVGTMKPGRLFDLSRAAMEYFGGIERGLISNLKVTILPLGRRYKPGPLTGEVEEIVEEIVAKDATPPPGISPTRAETPGAPITSGIALPPIPFITEVGEPLTDGRAPSAAMSAAERANCREQKCPSR
jgi:rare lipoprotein A